MNELHLLMRGLYLALEDIERRQNEAMEPFQRERKIVSRQLRALRLDPRAFSRAARIKMGSLRPDYADEDPIVQLYLTVLQDGEDNQTVRVENDP